MGEFFLDETIQRTAGFIVGSVVYTKSDLTPAVFNSLSEVGLRPGIDEYKSGNRMSDRPELAKLRYALCSLLSPHAKIGLLVLPYDKRSQLGNEALECLTKIIYANNLDLSRHTIYFDTGIIPETRARQDFQRTFASRCELRLNQDSKKIAGLQLADLTAHYMGTMLLAQMGKINKKVPSLHNDIDLSFELWARLRGSFFSSGRGIIDFHTTDESDFDQWIAARSVDVANYGLYISDYCNDRLREAADKRFGSCYMGCIH